MKVVRRFNRYELKYVLHVSQVPRLVEDLLHFMAPDERGDADGWYRIASLYHDSPDLHFYRAKLDGLRYRRKLRVRIYPDGRPVTGRTAAFLEIKQRMNLTVQKRRLVLPLDEATALCAGSAASGGLDGPDLATASEVSYMRRALRLRPTCIVSYRRRAFTGSRYERGMRVTLDTLVGGRTTALDLAEPMRGHLLVPPEMVVMEIKVDDRVPDWTTSLIARHECALTRVSKYCLAVGRGLRLMRSGAAGEESKWTARCSSSSN